MRIKPVKQYKEPQYPKKEQVQEKMLLQIVPVRWGKSAARIALSALAAMSLTACDGYKNMPDTAPIQTQTDYGILPGVPESPKPPFEYTDDGSFTVSNVTVAPLFIHGDGRGAYGCLVIAPPVFLSEAEALEVINEIAREYGLSFGGENTPSFDNVLEPSIFLNTSDGAYGEPSLMKFTADYADAEHGIALEFVSARDVQKWKDEQKRKLTEPYMEISAGVYDIRDAAAHISEALESADTPDAVVTGVLYDPCELTDEARKVVPVIEDENYEENTRALSIEQLKLQVRDFFEWLKSQGII